MKIVELNTGLFPDGPRVDAAIATLNSAHEVEQIDARQLDKNDEPAWEAIASAVLGADLIVTL
ncbi:MAG TPA: hypothetical protein DIU07_07100 [Rhodobacteraceae bacterium]|nr:hypothetical protein [Paracoccaceae bacterium]